MQSELTEKYRRLKINKQISLRFNRGGSTQLKGKKISKFNNHGFTLIELIATMLLIAVLLTIGIMAAAGRLAAPSFTTTIKDVASAIEFARSQAVTKRQSILIAFANSDSKLDVNEQQRRLYGIFEFFAVVDEDGNIKKDANGDPIYKYKAIQPWKKLENGVLFSDKSGASDSITKTTTTDYKFPVIDKNGNEAEINLPYIAFNKFGKASINGNQPTGVGNTIADSILFEKRGTADDEDLPSIKIHPLYGRIEIIDYKVN